MRQRNRESEERQRALENRGRGLETEKYGLWEDIKIRAPRIYRRIEGRDGAMDGYWIRITRVPLPANPAKPTFAPSGRTFAKRSGSFSEVTMKIDIIGESSELKSLSSDTLIVGSIRRWFFWHSGCPFGLGLFYRPWIYRPLAFRRDLALRGGGGAPLCARGDREERCGAERGAKADVPRSFRDWTRGFRVWGRAHHGFCRGYRDFRAPVAVAIGMTLFAMVRDVVVSQSRERAECQPMRQAVNEGCRGANAFNGCAARRRHPRPH